MITASLSVTSTYQKLSDLLVAAGIPDAVSNSVATESGYLFNRSATITVSVAAGYATIPSGTKATITPIAAMVFNPGLNATTTWIKTASSTATVEFAEGVSAYENPAINGIIGSITLTDDTIPKGSSSSLVNSSIVDNGTIVAVSEPIASTGYIKSSGLTGIGYATGAGAAVTQGTGRTTTVICNAPSGAITLISAAGSATPFSFTCTNSAVAATDTVVASQKSGTDAYAVNVTAVAAGSFRLTVTDLTGTTTESPVINFAVVKAVAA